MAGTPEPPFRAADMPIAHICLRPKSYRAEMSGTGGSKPTDTACCASVARMEVTGSSVKLWPLSSLVRLELEHRSGVR